jgi:hypothetical protein
VNKVKKLKLIKGDRRSIQGTVFTTKEFTEVPDDFPYEQFKEVLTDKDIVKLQEPKTKQKSSKKIKLEEDKIDEIEIEKDYLDPELVE